MEFRIADTFIDSLTRLPAPEQKAVKTTAFDLQVDPSAPGLRFHKLDRAKDRHFWSVRVGADVRLIVHRTASSLLLCYAAHHDDAYRWAERRKIERHPATGAAQLVELPERIEEAVPTPTAKPAAKPLFTAVDDATLLSYGVPPEWLPAVRAATEETLFDLAPHLPQEAAEALLDLATGTTPQRPKPAPREADPFQHPDAQRRFRLANFDELARALDYPWERWAVFLHPSQRQLVERSWAGPARVAGSAGTGKTIVALHRAAFLARAHPRAKILLATFSDALANALASRLRHLVGNEPEVAARIAVRSFAGLGAALYADAFGAPAIASAELVERLLRQAAAKVPGQKFPPRLLLGEWRDVVDAWQLKTWEAYRDVPRLGRKTRMGGKQREALWSVFAEVRKGLAAAGAMTIADVFERLTEHLVGGGARPFDFAVVDEAQDLGVPDARFLAALGAGRRDALFFAGDLGQRIFQQPFSWRSLGIDVRGRSHTLRINYRTSHQIRSHADRLLPGSIADVDGVAESRRGAISVFNGPPPEIRRLPTEAEEAKTVVAWLKARLEDGCRPEDTAVFVRSEAQVPRVLRMLKDGGLAAAALGEATRTTPGHVTVGTMHLAKGLEFRAVAVVGCDDEALPLQERIEAIADDADLEEVFHTERHLLYVACTRARDHLLVTGVEPVSEFLDDLAAAKA